MNSDNAVQSAQKHLDSRIVDADTTVSYESAGNLLIIADSMQVEELLDNISEEVHPAILFTDQCRPKLAVRLDKTNIPYLNQVNKIQITGHMGQFQVCAEYHVDKTSNSYEIDPPDQLQSEPSEKHFLFINNLADVVFDLIIDLQQSPALNRALSPPGYFSLAGNSQELTQLLSSLSDWIGVFDKPKYYHHIADRCSHSVNSIIGCQQCLKHCPTEAISSTHGQINIDAYLCQGCGDCATTCPSGAMVYRYPSVTAMQDQLRQSLDAFFQEGGTKPILLLYDQETGSEWLLLNQHLLPPATISCAVESISAYGLDTWLVAFAFGASSIILLSTDDDLTVSLSLLDQQIEILDAMLQGLGINKCPLQRCTAKSLPQLAPAYLELNNRATFSVHEDKTRMIRLAIDFIQSSFPAKKTYQPLPDSALFGEIVVDGKDCTLCMSCVSSCPQGALLSSEGLPQLNFIESNCVQCGICANTCPESAITLNPRFIYDKELGNSPRLLNEDEVVACVQCGKPFIGAQMLASMFEKVSDHPMFQGSQRALLQMCGDCRVIALHNKQSQQHSK